MVPGVTLVPETVINHPKTPTLVYLRYLQQLMCYLLVLFAQPGLVVVNRSTQAKQEARLPQAQLMCAASVIYQFSLLGRRYNFFSITSFKTVICKVCSATIFLYWLNSRSNSLSFLS